MCLGRVSALSSFPNSHGRNLPMPGTGAGRTIPSDASGGANGYGWRVAKNQRQHVEDAVDVAAPARAGYLPRTMVMGVLKR